MLAGASGLSGSLSLPSTFTVVTLPPSSTVAASSSATGGSLGFAEVGGNGGINGKGGERDANEPNVEVELVSSASKRRLAPLLESGSAFSASAGSTKSAPLEMWP